MPGMTDLPPLGEFAVSDFLFADLSQFPFEHTFSATTRQCLYSSPRKMRPIKALWRPQELVSDQSQRSKEMVLTFLSRSRAQPYRIDTIQEWFNNVSSRMSVALRYKSYASLYLPCQDRRRIWLGYHVNIRGTGARAFVYICRSHLPLPQASPIA